VTGCSNPGIDNDLDGYDICGTGDPVNPDGRAKDCNDNNEGVNPGTPENCFNSIDDDCNGLVDAADTLGCPRSDITGTVKYYRTAAGAEPGTDAVAGTEMKLVGTASGTTNTNSSGSYQFLDIIKGLVSVIPRKVGNFDSGISSLDASRVSQYRVGLYTMTPNQLIAADVSGNGSVSSYDASLISQFRVGIITRFPAATAKNSDWAFSPIQRDYAPLDSDRPNENYLGILYGDVTGNWAPGTALAASVVEEPAGIARGTPATEAESATAVTETSKGAAGPSACFLSLRPLARGDLPRGYRRLALHGRGCEGILGLDVDFSQPEGLSIVSVSRTQETSGFELASNDAGGMFKVSLFGTEPFQGEGNLLELVVEQAPPRGPSLSFEAVANEGQIAIATELPRPPRRGKR